MRFKKCFFIGVTLAVCLSGFHTILWGQEPNDVNNIEELKVIIVKLENKIEEQENKIKRLRIELQAEKAKLQAELDEQKRENERLKKLCSQAGIDTSPLKDIKPSISKSQNLIKVTLNQLYQFNKETITNLQKEEEYKNNYAGKWVQWTGKVGTVRYEKSKKDTIERYYVGFIQTHPAGENCAKEKIMILVKVEFNKMFKQQLLSFNEGDIVTYQGKLPDSYKGFDFGGCASYGELKAGKETIKVSGRLSLTDGKIVSP
jgi:hypothetical protein